MVLGMTTFCIWTNRKIYLGTLSYVHDNADITKDIEYRIYENYKINQIGVLFLLSFCSMQSMGFQFDITFNMTS